FDRRPAITLVKPAVLEEDLAPDCAASAPKGGRLCAAGLMDEMMHQVFVLRQEVGRSGVIVIRTDQRVERGIGERADDALNGIGWNAHVGVEGEKDFRSGGLRAGGARGAG